MMVCGISVRQEAYMRMDHIKAEGIAIPMEVIQGWRDRKAALDQMMVEAQREAAEISRKLDAVAVLAPELTSASLALTPPEPKSEGPSVISEIAKVVSAAKA